MKKWILLIEVQTCQRNNDLVSGDQKSGSVVQLVSVANVFIPINSNQCHKFLMSHLLALDEWLQHNWRFKAHFPRGHVPNLKYNAECSAPAQGQFDGEYLSGPSAQVLYLLLTCYKGELVFFSHLKSVQQYTYSHLTLLKTDILSLYLLYLNVKWFIFSF